MRVTFEKILIQNLKPGGGTFGLSKMEKSKTPGKMERIQKEIINENLNVSMSLQEEGFLEVSLINKQGNLIYNFCKMVKNGLYQHFISTRYIDAGPYILRISLNGKSEVSSLKV